MIDFVKINNLTLGPKIQDLLDFELKVNHRTGEELFNRKRSAYLKNLIFTICPGERFVKMQGSLHKFSNQGGLNNDRFTFDRYLQVTDDLVDYVSSDDNINVLEFGVNLQTDFDPSELIDNLITHLKKPFNKTIYHGMQYSQCEYKHYIIKVYNKGLHQGPSGSHILRIEVKYLRMQKLFPDGLKWSYLQSVETWSYLGEILRKKFSEIIFYDPTIDLKSIPEKESQFIKDGRNPFYWQDLTGPHVSRTRKQYQNLIRKHGTRFSVLYDLLDQEISELVKSYQYSSTVNDQTNSIEFQEMVKKSPLLYSNISPSTVSTTTDYVCKVTGIDISMQKSESMFLCSAGIKYLYNHDRDLYDKLSDERLSSKWLRYPLEIQFREIAHSIRNEYYNPKNNTKHSLQKIMKDPVLFDIQLMISTEKRDLIFT